MAGIKPPQDYWIRKWKRAQALVFIASLCSFGLGLTIGVSFVWNKARWCVR